MQVFIYLCLRLPFGKFQFISSVIGLLLAFIVAIPSDLFATQANSKSDIRDGGVLKITLEKPKARYSSASEYASLVGVASDWVPPMESGMQYRYRVELVGLGDGTKFDRIMTSCQCGDFKLDKNTIQENQVLSGDLLWRTPQSSKTGHTSLTATIYSGKSVVAEIRLAALLSGCASIESPREGVRVGDGFFEWTLPVTVTEPLSLDSMAAELSEELQGFSLELTKVELGKADQNRKSKSPGSVEVERGKIVIRAHEAVVGNRFRFGSLSLAAKDRQGKTFVKDLALSIRPLIRVSPLRLEFKQLVTEAESVESSNKQPVEGNRDAPLVAKALIQFDNSILQTINREGFTESSETPSSASTTWKELLASGDMSFSLVLVSKDNELERRAKLKTTHLGSNVFRVVASIGNPGTRSELSGEWHITVGDKKYTFPSFAVVR